MATFDWHTNDFSEIPYTVYSDDDIYAQEQEQIFQGNTWNFLGLECEIPEPGTYKTTLVGDVPVIVVRDETGSGVRRPPRRSECSHHWTHNRDSPVDPHRYRVAHRCW